MNLLRASCLAIFLFPRFSTGDGAGWRGDGTGCYPSAHPPTEWNIDGEKNILWQAEAGKGHSTPVVLGERIFVTAEKDRLLCLHRSQGTVLWKADNGYLSLPPGATVPEKRPPAAPGCGYSTPTPVSDGRFVFAVHGTGIVACYSIDGERRWIRYLDLPQANQYGRSASPLLVSRSLVVSMGGLLSLDPETGKILWHTGEARPSYGTPAVARVGDQSVVITGRGDCVRVADGEILTRKIGSSLYSSPLVHKGIVVFAGPPIVAVKLPEDPGGPWKLPRLWEEDDVEGEIFSSPVVHEGVLFCASNDGMLYALDLLTGKTVYRKQLEIPSASGLPGSEPANLYGSLAIAGGYLLLSNDAGDTLVLEPGREYREISHNFIHRGSGASPVPDGDRLFLRGRTKIYCIGRN